MGAGKLPRILKLGGNTWRLSGPDFWFLFQFLCHVTLKLAVSRSRPSVPYGANLWRWFVDEAVRRVCCDHLSWWKVLGARRLQPSISGRLRQSSPPPPRWWWRRWSQLAGYCSSSAGGGTAADTRRRRGPLLVERPARGRRTASRACSARRTWRQTAAAARCTAVQSTRAPTTRPDGRHDPLTCDTNHQQAVNQKKLAPTTAPWPTTAMFCASWA